jgi:DNA-binding NtrC family response regulator
LARAAAATDSAVLISGEPGSGKSFLARRIHSLSVRSAEPFVGLATGLERSLRLADRGTLHVDEVGDLSVDDQTALLRFLRRDSGAAGGERSVPDVRVVAMSHFDLAELVQRGRFGADLFHRISAVRLYIPPLRTRPDDIPVLAEHFAREIAARIGRPAPEIPAFTLGLLAARPWPGNVRELRNVIERVVLFGSTRGLEHLRLSGANADPQERFSEMPDLHLRRLLGRFERQLVIEALRRAGGSSKEAARLLGIAPNNLGYFVRKHGLPHWGRHRVLAAPRPTN